MKGHRRVKKHTKSLHPQSQTSFKQHLREIRSLCPAEEVQKAWKHFSKTLHSIVKEMKTDASHSSSENSSSEPSLFSQPPVDFPVWSNLKTKWHSKSAAGSVVLAWNRCPSHALLTPVPVMIKRNTDVFNQTKPNTQESHKLINSGTCSAHLLLSYTCSVSAACLRRDLQSARLTPM